MIKIVSRTHIQVLAVIGLLAVTAVWGSTFFLIKDLIHHISAISFLAIRFIVAALVICFFFGPRLVRASQRTWINGSILGSIYAAGQLFQTFGLHGTDAAVSGFITGMYVVLTPIFVWLLFRQKIGAITIAATIIATTGLMVLSLRGFALGLHECITFIGSVFYALHIVYLGRWSKHDNVCDLALIQIIAIAAICALISVPMGLDLPRTAGQWMSIFYMALIAGIGAMMMQTWAQKYLSASRAAIIMTMEPVFAALFAYCCGGETITARVLVGGSLVIVAMLMTELHSAYRLQKRIAHTSREQ
ncbi:MAG: DMT family transporter [Actinomycetaceae bacterium]|nr:DMT family transporter [Actinomycetaceae bacterium]